MTTIIPITKARGKLSSLAEKAIGEDYVILTKGGMPKAALVDMSYLLKLQSDIRKLYKKTFIDKDLLKFTRIFTNKEIKEWQKEDEL